MNPWFIAGPAAVAALGGLATYGAGYPRCQWFGPTIRFTPSLGQLAITFDDGPNPAITPQLLNLLDRYQARATFFLIGKFVRECPGLVQEMSARGHAIGNHTETHPNLALLGRRRQREELLRCQEAIASALGAPAELMRPPFGMRNPLLDGSVREAGIRGVVMWTLITGDWHAKSAEWLIPRMQAISTRTEKARRGEPVWPGGEILCLHDGNHAQQNGDRRHTVAALEHWLPRWRDLGLEFVTISATAGATSAKGQPAH